MISYVKGNVKFVDAQQLFVVLRSGEIGFSVGVSQPSNFQKDQDVELHTYLHWNQEQGPSLYGFQTIEERCLLFNYRLLRYWSKNGTFNVKSNIYW